MAPEANSFAGSLTPFQASILNVLCALDVIPAKPEELAKKIGELINLDPKEVARAMRGPAFRAAFQEIFLTVAHMQMGEVIEATVNAAKSLDAKAADRRLYFDLMGMLKKPKVEKEKSPQEPQDTPEELERKKKEINDRLRLVNSRPIAAEVSNAKK